MKNPLGIVVHSFDKGLLLHLLADGRHKNVISASVQCAF